MQISIDNRALVKRFNELVENEHVDLALTALVEAMRDARLSVRGSGPFNYYEMPDHKTRAFAATQFFRVVGLIAPQQVKVSGTVGHVHTSTDELLAAAREKFALTSGIVGEYLPNGTKMAEVVQEPALVPFDD